MANNDISHFRSLATQFLSDAKRSLTRGQFLAAVAEHQNQFIHDNLDFSTEPNRWSYAFHADTLPIQSVGRIDIGANDKYGNSSVKVINVSPA